MGPVPDTPFCAQPLLPARPPEHHVPLLCHLQMGDSGRYQCLAENEMGAVEKVVVLLLQSECPPPRSGPWVGRCEWASRESCAKAVACMGRTPSRAPCHAPGAQACRRDCPGGQCTHVRGCISSSQYGQPECMCLQFGAVGTVRGGILIHVCGEHAQTSPSGH